jgi:predicted TIM-barrel fold metal-dependent hydrolase
MDHLNRRAVMGAGLALAAASSAMAKDLKVSFAVPDGACDSHHHIYDPRFPYQANAVLKPPYATVSAYRVLQKKIGTSRNVMVQPSTYGTDNSCLMDVLAQMGDNARAVCVVNASVTDAELKKLHAAGTRGVRVQFGLGNPVSADEVKPLAKRIAAMGWHIQTNMPGEQLVAMEALLLGLPCPVIIDHLGRAIDTNSAHYNTVRKLLDSDHGWVKLSGAYLYGGGTAPNYAGASEAARGYIKAAPERCVWGSDWPHPDATKKLNPVAMPDDVTLINLMPQWAPDAKLRHRILVENPETFYGFDPAKRPKAL